MASRREKKLSARALMLLCRSSSFRYRLSRLAKMGEDLPCDVALEAAHDLRLRLSFGGATADIVDSGLVTAHPCNDDPVEGGIGLAIASAVQPVAAGLAAGGRHRAGAAHFGECRFRADALRIIADQDQHLSGRSRCDAGCCDELRAMGCGQRVQLAVVPLYLLAQRQPAPG